MEYRKINTYMLKGDDNVVYRVETSANESELEELWIELLEAIENGRMDEELIDVVPEGCEITVVEIETHRYRIKLQYIGYFRDFMHEKGFIFDYTQRFEYM